MYLLVVVVVLVFVVFEVDAVAGNMENHNKLDFYMILKLTRTA
jgi:hypothetical protein